MSILIALVLLNLAGIAYAQSAIPPSGSIDTSGFDKVLEPVWKVYGLIKYIATAIAMIFLVFAGIMFMTSGDDITKRDKAKNMIAFVVVGLGVIWIAPSLVELFVT